MTCTPPTARLIAASHDMRDALEEIRDLSQGEPTPAVIIRLERIVELADAALAKASPEESRDKPVP